MKTRKEVEKIVGLKHRAIQEYEKANLAIRPTFENKYGHLLYNEQDIERLWQLRFYKELGYNISQIKALEQDDAFETQKEMERVIVALEEKKAKLDNMIAIARMIKETGVTFNTLRHCTKIDKINADDTFAILGTALKLAKGDEEADIFCEVFTDRDYEEIFELLEKVIRCHDKQVNCESSKVQSYIKKVHMIVAKALSESVMFFRMNTMVIAPDGEVGKMLVAEMGEERVRYLWNAIQYYCEENVENETDKVLVEALENIEKLAKMKYTASSDDVQAEIRKFHMFYSQITILTEEAQIESVRRLGKFLESKAIKNIVDKGKEKGIAWFYSKAIEIYCDNLCKIKD